jgi:titin
MRADPLHLPGGAVRPRSIKHPIALVATFLLLLTATAFPVLGGLGPSAGAATTVTQTFGFDNDTLQGFTVPAGVTSIAITSTGGQGGWGGADSSGNPAPGGYQGVVSGSMSVTPGEYFTIAVGAGADEPIDVGCTPGNDWSSPGDPNDAVSGISPLNQYDGGMGGAPGPNGCSGYGGAGGAGTAVEIGSSPDDPTSVGTIVAGGGGGDGGSGQYPLVVGQINLASYVPQSTPTPITYGIPAGCAPDCASENTIESPSPLSAEPTQGQDGISVFTMCGGSLDGNEADQYFDTGAPQGEAGCDGGGGAGGGGGAAGGAAGSDQFGSGSSDEWYGQGGSPGENSTGGIPGLHALDAYYADADTGAPNFDNSFADPGSAYDGSVVITYATGVPGIPTGLSASAGEGSASLQWSAPDPGADPISDYVVQYSSDGGADWTTYDTGATATSATVTGLTDGTPYIFEVQAVNSDGSGPFSMPTGTVEPSGPPAAPTITSISPEDGALQVAFTPPTSSAPITGYRYQLDGTGPWQSVATTMSPLTISGLTDGTPYSVEIEAVNSTGTGPASNSMSQTPEALPGAPTITSVTAGAYTATVAFTPGSTGGSAITGYQYSVDGGATWVPTSTTSPVDVYGLSDGTGYTFELQAVSGAGAGATASTSFTTTAAPGAPTITAIAPGDGTLAVTVAEPSGNGSPITDYEWSTDAGQDWYSEGTFGTPCRTSAGSVTCTIAASSVDGTTSLVNGTSYPVELRAVNADAAGAASAPVDGTPSTTPGAPSIVTGADGMVASDRSLMVTFDPPVDDGGAPVADYQYSTDAGATWHERADGQSATSTTMTITALSSDGTTALADGVTYDVELRAVNAAGSGPGSAVATGIPVTVPAAPSITTVTPENGALAVAFTPGSNGGSVVTSYDYSLDGGPWTSSGSLTPGLTIGGLVNGTAYTVQVRADNDQGDSSPSASAPGTPATAPGQPVISSTSRGNATLSVSYSEPSTGGSPVVAVQYSTDGGATWRTAASDADPLVITTLSADGVTPVVNGTSYPVEIRAVNTVGASVASLPVDVAPATVPTAPSVTLTPEDGALTVAAVVGDDGGSSVTGMEYSVDHGAWTPTGTTSPTFTITGLDNGTTYMVAVRADSAIGDGDPSAPQSAAPLTVPDAPLGVLAASDSESADVTWTAPGSDGGSPITGYTATAYASSDGTSPVGTCSTTTLACTVSGLNDGTTYYVGVVATNAAGSGVSSDPLQPVVPVARPQSPVITGISAGDSYLSVSFSPGDPGGDPVTSFQYSLDGVDTWTSTGGTTSPFVIDGLTDGTTYTVELEGVSAAGTSPASTPLSGTPYTYPGPVLASSITAYGEDGGAVVNWAPPASDGGAPISDQTVNGINDSAYTVTAFDSPSAGNQIATCTTSGDLTCSLSGLTDGNTDYISIQAGNAAGLSDRSTPRVAVTPSASDITSPLLSGGEVGVSYDVVPAASGGSGSYSWTVEDGTLPDGLTLDQSSGEVTGTPTTAGTATFTLVATDLGGQQATQAESVSIAPAPALGPSTLPAGEVGVPYDATPSAIGGTGPFAWSVADGSLPDGLTLNPSTGEVSGTPTTAGSFPLTLVVTDGNEQMATRAQTVHIATDPTAAADRTLDGLVGAPMDAQLAVAGGTGPDTWVLESGSLPPGLAMAADGALTGVPTQVGTFSSTVQVTDALDQTASEAVTVVVTPTSLNSRRMAVTIDGGGYWLVSADGAVACFGDARSYGSENGKHLNQPIVGIAATPDGKGYWLVGADGGVFNFGDAGFYGSEGGKHLNQALLGIVATPDGDGYWLVASDGGVFNFGDAGFYGSEGGGRLNEPVVGMAATPDGRGYWMVAADGGIFSFGDAAFHGSEGGQHLNRPVVGMASTPDGKGYWLVASDGGVFTFGDATFFGSAAAEPLNAPVDGIEATSDGRGYWMVAADGGIFTYGDAHFLGSGA